MEPAAGVSLRALADSPVLRRELALMRPERFARELAAAGAVLLIATVLLGLFGQHLHAQMLLREMAGCLVAPIHLGLGVVLWARLERFRSSGIPEDLQLTALRPAEVIGAWYMALMVRWLAGPAVLIAALPLFPEVVDPIHPVLHLVFMAGALATLEFFARIQLLIALHGRGAVLLIRVCLTAGLGALATFGVAGAVERLAYSGPVTMALAVAAAAAGVLVLNVLTFLPFVGLAGGRYERSILVAEEGTTDALDRPPPPKLFR